MAVGETPPMTLAKQRIRTELHTATDWSHHTMVVGKCMLLYEH